MSVAIDPRIRARRIAVRKEEGHKRLRRVSIVAGAAAVVVACWGITRTPLLDVDQIQVEGAAHTGAERVASASGIDRGDVLLTLGLGGAARRVADLPWVETVHVRRRWPGTVRFTVVERQPAATVPAKGGGWLLLDVTGRQLAVQIATPTGVPRVEIPPVVPALGRELGASGTAVLDLAAALPDALRGRLVALRPGAGGTVEGTVALPGGGMARVLLGTPTQVPAKWLALLSVLDAAETANVAVIDVRVPAAPALTRR